MPLSRAGKMGFGVKDLRCEWLSSPADAGVRMSKWTNRLDEIELDM